MLEIDYLSINHTHPICAQLVIFTHVLKKPFSRITLFFTGAYGGRFEIICVLW